MLSPLPDTAENDLIFNFDAQRGNEKYSFFLRIVIFRFLAREDPNLQSCTVDYVFFFFFVI